MKTPDEHIADIKQLLDTISKQLNITLPRVHHSFDPNINTNTALFRELYNNSIKKSVEIINLEMPNAVLFYDTTAIMKYALSKAQPNGSFIELGVFSGTTLTIMAKYRPNIKFDGFDSFLGLPDEWHGWQNFDFDRQGTIPELPDNVTIHKGWFKETLPPYAESIETVSFLHVDCDIYASTKTAFIALEEKIQPGTVILFDEYFCYPNFEMHERRAFAEFLDKTMFVPQWIAVCGQRAACIIRDPTFQSERTP